MFSKVIKNCSCKGLKETRTTTTTKKKKITCVAKIRSQSDLGILELKSTLEPVQGYAELHSSVGSVAGLRTGGSIPVSANILSED